MISQNQKATPDSTLATANTRIKPLVEALKDFAKEQKILVKTEKPQDKELKQLMTSVTPKLISYLKTLDTDTAVIPPFVKELLKLPHHHEKFSIPVQLSLHAINKRLVTKLQEELINIPCKEDKVIALIDSGIDTHMQIGGFSLDPDEIHWPLIAVTLRRRLMKASALLLNDVNRDFTKIPVHYIGDAIILMVQDGLNDQELGACIDLLASLGRNKLSVNHLFSILRQEFADASIVRLVGNSNDAVINKYFDLLSYLYEHGLPARDMCTLLDSRELLQNPILNRKPDSLLRYLNFYIQLLKDNPSAKMINTITKLFSFDHSSSSHVRNFLITELDKDFSKPTKIYLNLLTEILPFTTNVSLTSAPSIKKINNETTLLQSKYIQHNNKKKLHPFEILPIKHHFFQFLKPKDIHTLSATSHQMRHATADYRIRKLVKTLSEFAHEQKIPIDEKLPLDTRLKYLSSNLSIPLSQFLKQFDQPNIATPLLATQLLKQPYHPNMLHISIQMALYRINQQLIKKLRAELQRQEINEEKIIELINTGIDVNEKGGMHAIRNHWPLLATVINRMLFKTSHLLLNDARLNLDEDTIRAIVQAIDLLLNQTRLNLEQLNHLLDLLSLLIKNGFPSQSIYQILKQDADPNASIQNYIVAASNDVTANKYLAILNSLYEKKIPTAHIISLLEANFMLRLSDIVSPLTIEQYLHFYVRLLKEQPCPQVIEVILSLFYYENIPQEDSFASRIAIRGSDFSNANKICIQLLRDILHISNDTQLIFSALNSQAEGQWFYGLCLARCQDQEVFKEFQLLLFDLASLETSHYHHDEKREPLSNILQLLNLHNFRNWSLVHLMPQYQEDNIPRHFLLLRYLLAHGASPNDILASINKADTDNNETFGFLLGLYASSSTSEYLKLLIDLLNAGANSRAIYQLLLCTSETQTQAMLFAQNFKEPENILYLTLLRKLMQHGVSSREIIHALKLQNATGSAYQHKLAFKSSMKCVQAYQEFLLHLLKDKTLTKDIFNLIKLKTTDYNSTMGHSIALIHGEDTSIQHLAIIQTLLNNGLSALDACIYLAMQNEQGRDFGLCLAVAQHERATELFMHLLHRLLDNGAPPDIICTLIGSSYENGWDFFSAASRHADFNLHTYFNLLARLEKNVRPGLEPISLIKLRLRLDNTISESKYPCEQIKRKIATLSNEMIRQLFAIKQVTAYHDFFNAIDPMLKQYQIIIDNCSLFEDMLLSLSGMQTRPTHIQFSAYNIIDDYPYISFFKVGYSDEQAKEFVEKLNKHFLGLAIYGGKNNDMQEIIINHEILVHQVLAVNGVFQQHVSNQFAKNPLLMTAYQMESGFIPKINFEQKILVKLLKALGSKSKEANAISFHIPQTLLKMVNIDETIHAEATLDPADKTEYAEAEAIIILRLAISKTAAQSFVTRLNKQFNSISASIMNDTGMIKVIALSKSLLSSEEFLCAFERCFNRPSTKPSAQLNHFGILHKLSPLFSIAVTDDHPEPIGESLTIP